VVFLPPNPGGSSAVLRGLNTEARAHASSLTVSWPGLKVQEFHSGACELLLMCKTRLVFPVHAFQQQGHEEEVGEVVDRKGGFDAVWREFRRAIDLDDSVED
jgi:hypothetical protein